MGGRGEFSWLLTAAGSWEGLGLPGSVMHGSGYGLEDPWEDDLRKRGRDHEPRPVVYKDEERKDLEGAGRRDSGDPRPLVTCHPGQESLTGLSSNTELYDHGKQNVHLHISHQCLGSHPEI